MSQMFCEVTSDFIGGVFTSDIIGGVFMTIQVFYVVTGGL